MNLLELAQKRCSIRKYASSPVEDEKLAYILEAGRMAPSAVNFQPWYFVIIRQEAGRAKIQDAMHANGSDPQPLYILVCGDHSQSWKRSSDRKDHMDIDVAIATEHISLAAAEQGLGSCWVCNLTRIYAGKHFNFTRHDRAGGYTHDRLSGKSGSFLNRLPKNGKRWRRSSRKKHF